MQESKERLREVGWGAEAAGADVAGVGKGIRMQQLRLHP